MKKARIILFAIAALTIIGGILSFSISKFNGTPRLAIYMAGQSTSYVCVVNQKSYYTSIPFCITTAIWRTNVGILVSTFSTSTSTTRAIATDGATTICTYPICVNFTTCTTLID